MHAVGTSTTIRLGTGNYRNNYIQQLSTSVWFSGNYKILIPCCNILSSCLGYTLSTPDHSNSVGQSHYIVSGHLVESVGLSSACSGGRSLRLGILDQPRQFSAWLHGTVFCVPELLQVNLNAERDNNIQTIIAMMPKGVQFLIACKPW